MSIHLLVTYDVSDDTKRRRVYQTLSKYGAWKQYSVFELVVSHGDREELIDQLESLVGDSPGDRVQLYRICESCDEPVVNIGESRKEDKSTVI